MNSNEKSLELVDRFLQSWTKRIFYLSGMVFLSGIFSGSVLGVPISSLGTHLRKSNFWELFIHNIKICFFILVVGGITGSIYAHIVLFINGFLIGKLLIFLYSAEKLQQVITGLLPHFFFEIFGLMIFSALSSLPLIVGYQILKTGNTQLFIKFFQILFYGLLLGFALIAVAALIEAKISKVS